MKKVELLAPAGSLDKAKIALMYGADAVYVGGKQFSLRARASNFELEDLKELSEFAHERNKKVYVTMNIIPHDEDLQGLDEYLKYLESIKIDAIITSSRYIMSRALEVAPNVERHLSTQMSTTNSLSIDYYKKIGVERVVLAREVTLCEIEKIMKKTDVEVEVFIHGGMCSSYSGHCVLSNHMTNRDANRGGCAHSCRWNYHLFMGDTKISDDDKFQFSSKDLMAVNQIERLFNYTDSFKIEGRMKSIHYIATVTKVYRMLIDEYYETGKIADYDYYRKEIEKAENRLFSHGFLLGNTTINEQLYNMRSENPTQDFVGIVLDYNESTQEALIEVRNHFKPYSTLEAFGPNLRSTKFTITTIVNEKGELVDAARHPKEHVTIISPIKLAKFDMIRLVK